MYIVAEKVIVNNYIKSYPSFHFIFKLKDKVPYTEIRKRTRVQDIVQFVLKQKWKWAGRVARLDDNRWTQKVTE